MRQRLLTTGGVPVPPEDPPAAEAPAPRRPLRSDGREWETVDGRRVHDQCGGEVAVSRAGTTLRADCGKCGAGWWRRGGDEPWKPTR